MDTPSTSNSQPPDKKGYGKKPLWLWVLGYVILAVIVYGLVYLIFFHHTGSSSGGYSY